jgi:NAD-dependent dihydropyrimidine dehydrogenase PreA subunit
MRYLSNVTSLRFYQDKCTGCFRCVEVCPHGIFDMNDRKAIVTDRDLGMECGACARNCAFGALSVNAGVGCSAAIIKGMTTGSEPSCGCSDAAPCC